MLLLLSPALWFQIWTACLQCWTDDRGWLHSTPKKYWTIMVVTRYYLLALENQNCIKSTNFYWHPLVLKVYCTIFSSFGAVSSEGLNYTLMRIAWYRDPLDSRLKNRLFKQSSIYDSQLNGQTGTISLHISKTKQKVIFIYHL